MAVRQISTNSGRSSQFSDVDRSMLDVVFDMRSETAPLIFGIMASTFVHPRFERLCVAFASAFEDMVTYGDAERRTGSEYL
jgi:hypothetical protein